MKAKILVVGGGAMGTCIALHAATRCDPLKEPVILIEKDRLGAGSSGRSNAIIHQGYGDRQLAGMARDALKVYAGLEQNTGRSVGYRRTGVLLFAGPNDTAARAELEANIEMQSSIGIDVRRVEAEEIRGIVPGIEVEDGTLGAFEPDGGFVDSARTIQAFATLARDRGAATRIGVKNPTILVENGRAIGVETSAGTFYAPMIVLATGPWTPFILRDFNIDLPLRVVRTQQHFIRMPIPSRDDEDEATFDSSDSSEFETRFVPDPLDRMPVAHPVLYDLQKGLSIRCEPSEARTRITRLGFKQLPDVSDPEQLDREVDPEFIRWARQSASSRLPVYETMPDVGSQAAWITLTPDERPIVGPVKEMPGLYVATGFSGNDFQLAPSIGEGMAQMLMDEPVSAFDPEFFSLERFQQART
ncbi:MAG: sarcosine oxidase subunit beta [Chlamydiales bacterium]